MRLAQCLGAVPAKHRSSVAGAIGLASKAKTVEIAEALLDPEQLSQLINRLPASVRGRAARKTLCGTVQASGAYYYAPAGDSADLELERYGLAFAFRGPWRTEYDLAEDLRGPLLEALAQGHAEGMKPPRAQRWVGAPLQLAHDAAAVWAALHREPARVKTDGSLYQRAWPKLEAALPALDVFGAPDVLRARRLGTALVALRQEGCLRVRVDDVSGWETKRELVPAGSLGRTLESPPMQLRNRLLEHTASEATDVAGLALLKVTAARGGVSLASYGSALERFLEQGGERLDPSLSPVQRSLLGVQVGWLLGLAEIGFDGEGKPVAVRPTSAMFEAWSGVGSTSEELDAAGGRGSTSHEAHAGPGPRAVCQGNFEIVLLAHPAPSDRLTLELACEPVLGQPHVYRITRRSVGVGERASVGPGGVLGALARLAGELPQNVARSVSDWAAAAGPPLRVRTAMMLDAGDAHTADALAAGPLADLVLERVGERLLAFTAGRLDELRRALAGAGRELEPGLEKISGSWEEREPRETGVERAWQAYVPVAVPKARLVSTLRADRGAPDVPIHGSAVEGLKDFDLDEPLEVILEAIENEEEVVIVYAGAGGVSHRCIRPIEVVGSQLRAVSNARGDESQFWVQSIIAAAPLAT
ncbi:MAG: hypothetical protein ACR2OB_10620 [Solirubrobacteraceae bacterium]